jgi:hypothetical protein
MALPSMARAQAAQAQVTVFLQKAQAVVGDAAQQSGLFSTAGRRSRSPTAKQLYQQQQQQATALAEKQDAEFKAARDRENRDAARLAAGLGDGGGNTLMESAAGMTQANGNAMQGAPPPRKSVRPTALS